MRLLISHQHDLFKINECELLYVLTCSTKATVVTQDASGGGHHFHEYWFRSDLGFAAFLQA
jgi:hypothetical protein